MIFNYAFLHFLRVRDETGIQSIFNDDSQNLLH